MNKEEEKIQHESFGQVQFSRVQSGGGVNFYGSELPQNNYITMKICQSEVNRTLTQDWYFAREQIIQIRMSCSQFSELITSLNSGSGVPCTIERVKGDKIPELPSQENRKEFVHRKFEERMKSFASLIRERQQKAKELVKKKTLSKEDMFQLQSHIDWLTTEVVDNIPFFAKCFQETMDEVVFEAKTEVENAIQHKINVLGLEALHNQNKLLSNE